MTDTDLLAQVPLFASLKRDHVDKLANKLTVQTYQRGITIFHKGDPGSRLYVIKTGQVKITSASPEGEEMILTILADNDFFGELSLLDGQPRSASATAMSTTQTLTLHRPDFLDVLREHPEVLSDVLVVLTERLRHSDHLVDDAFFLGLPARLAKRLIQLGEKHGVETDNGLEIDLDLTQQDLADAVGASRVAVNRQLGIYQDGSIIRLARKRIIILRPDELRKHI